MRIKTEVKQVKSEDNLTHAMLKGLNKSQANWAKIELKKHLDAGIDVHYGMIRKMAQSMFLNSTPSEGGKIE